jgi:hypothetical protein
MKLAAYLLITLSVIAGSLAASTAYLVRLQGANPEMLSTLRLGSPAGTYNPAAADSAFAERLTAVRAELDAERRVAANPLKPETTPRVPVAVPPVQTEPTGESVLRAREAVPSVGRAGDRLTPELVALLSESGVTFVKVTEFSVARWPHAWLFALSCLGLLAGAWMVRRARRVALAAAEVAGPAAVEDATDAATVFVRLSGRLHTLAEELARTTDEDIRLTAIVRYIGQIQRDDVPAFVADRPALVNRLSLAGYAELMDSFAAMERQLNRAWSAAADAHLPESEDCLRNAQPLVVETLRRLRSSRPA